VSVDSSGVQGNGVSGLYGIAVSRDGRYVAFESTANNLVPGDTNGHRDIFVRDRSNGTTQRASVDSGGVQGNGNSTRPSITPDGRYVLYASGASNLVPGDSNSTMDIFIHDQATEPRSA
jgi:Tol biopolymer transport system component